MWHNARRLRKNSLSIIYVKEYFCFSLHRKILHKHKINHRISWNLTIICLKDIQSNVKSFQRNAFFFNGNIISSTMALGHLGYSVHQGNSGSLALLSLFPFKSSFILSTCHENQYWKSMRNTGNYLLGVLVNHSIKKERIKNISVALGHLGYSVHSGTPGVSHSYHCFRLKVVLCCQHVMRINTESQLVILEIIC